jgi:Flp pilus assembly protein TadD
MATEERFKAGIESGLRAYHQGHLESARTAFEQALALAPDHPDAMHLLGVTLLELGHAGPAVDYLERAARKLRHDPVTVGHLAQAYFVVARYAESQAAFRKAGRLDPRAVQFSLGVATSLAMQGKFGEAETLLRRLADRFPQNVLAWSNLGHVLRDQGRVEDALACYRRVLELDAHSIDARNDLGAALHRLQRFEEAEREYRACVEMAPDHFVARCNLASVVIDLGRFDEAAAMCRRIIARAPALALPHTFLGAALGHQGKSLEALECHRLAAELSPHDVKTVENYAGALVDAGYFDEGLRGFTRALALDPHSNSARQNLAAALLRHGRLAEGWVEYGYRPPVQRFHEKFPHVALSRTLPPDLHGRRVCVLQEQGLGDEIFFLRYAPQLHAAGARITYRASHQIASLLERVAGIAEVLAENAVPPPTDNVMLAGDLPHALSDYPACPLPAIDGSPTSARPRDFPWRAAVFWPQVPPPLALTPLAEQLASVRVRLARIGDPPYVGLTWKSGIPPRDQRGIAWTLYKEIDLSLFATALKDLPGTFIALQRKPAPGEIGAFSNLVGKAVHDFTDLNENLEAMLALLALIDEYVGVSNTNLHLRASVGKTANVLVPCPAEWRWMDTGGSSPWFPGCRIYRQSLAGDWDVALATLKHDLGNTTQNLCQ